MIYYYSARTGDIPLSVLKCFVLSRARPCMHSSSLSALSFGVATNLFRLAPPSIFRSHRHGSKHRSHSFIFLPLCLNQPSSSTSQASRLAAAVATKRFIDWLKTNGVNLSDKSDWGRAPHALAVADETYDDGEPAGRGLIAVRSIVQGEPLFEIPAHLVLTKEVAVRCVGKVLEDVDEYVALAVLLIHERAKGDDSFWKEYLDVLPKDEELIPLFRWTEEDLALLKGSPTLVACASLKEKLCREYATAVADIFEKDRNLFSEDVYTWGAWEWAFAVLFSRTVLLRKESILALVPYADFLNHNPFCTSYIEMEKRILRKEKYVCCFVDRPYSKMNQVFVTYGPKSNAELLLLYGFIVDRNPYDTVEVSVSLDENDPLYERKRQVRESSGVGQAARFPLYIDRYPKELIEYLRFCVATADEFESDFGEFISEENESLVAAAIIRCCEDALEAYPQTLEEDSALIKDKRLYKALPLKNRWAIRQRRNEKRILKRTIANIEKEIEKPEYLFHPAANK